MQAKGGSCYFFYKLSDEVHRIDERYNRLRNTVFPAYIKNKETTILLPPHHCGKYLISLGKSA